MEIKRPGSKTPNVNTPENTPPVERSGKFEGKIRADRTPESAPSATASALQDIKARFTKQDLDDKTKVEKVIAYTVNEVLLGGLPKNLQLPAADRASVAGVMANDPIIRGKVMNLLRKTLE